MSSVLLASTPSTGVKKPLTLHVKVGKRTALRERPRQNAAWWASDRAHPARDGWLIIPADAARRDWPRSAREALRPVYRSATSGSAQPLVPYRCSTNAARSL